MTIVTIGPHRVEVCEGSARASGKVCQRPSRTQRIFVRLACNNLSVLRVGLGGLQFPRAMPKCAACAGKKRFHSAIGGCRRAMEHPSPITVV